jgi:MFS family permease
MTKPADPVPARSEEEPVSFPPGLHNAFLFSAFNALSYQLVLSSPMVLYAKTLGASATVLGIIVGMMPLLVIFQIPAANYIARIGFKRFVYAGWGTRVMFIFAMALVPLTGSFLDGRNRLALMLMLLFCFNLSRGISSSAWLPWITALVPSSLRGKYLSRDAAVQNLSSFITFLVAAICLSGHVGGNGPNAEWEPRPWQFAILFAFSAVTGAISLSFLKRIPDVEVSDENQAEPDGNPSAAASSPARRKSKQAVPWMEMVRYAPFTKLLRAVVGWSVAYGGMTAFTVAFLKAEAGMAEGQILLVTSTAFLGGLSSLWFLGSRLDRLGSKPVLTFCFAMWLSVLAGWMALSGRALPLRLPVVLVLQFLMGLLAALVQMSNTRLAMAVIPPMGRNHFFAIYSVLGNVTLGLAPIAWGLLIDAVGKRSSFWLGLEWNRFTVFFAAAALAYGITLGLARRLDEPEAVSMEQLLREILIQSPQRAWLRLWPRG